MSTLSHESGTVSDGESTHTMDPAGSWMQRHPAGLYTHALSVLLSVTNNLQDAALPDSPTVLKALAFANFDYVHRLRRLWLKNCASSIEQEHRGYTLRVFVSDSAGNFGHLVHYLRRFCFFKSTWHQLASPPVMTEIALTVQDVESAHLDYHLEDCGPLERFSCQWQWTDQFIPRNLVHLPSLHSSLQRVRKTLTHLTIDTSESASRVDIDLDIPALGSLRKFEALVYLNVAGLVLWGDDDITELVSLSLLLPESLETLIIKNEWDDDVEDALHQLSIDCAASMPKLKTVECTWRPAPRYIAHYLIEAFRAVAVELALELEDA
ncbi:hypothetical protein OPT61_g6885 [Boeremia exigua]|uniref:Uncharacterized protein n=1 Tax=Boeremia exigua TaxID=749465 RepID=A0ACC2I4B5_9PLEO|nr:hypothetical protein OPT61_g6885 [Boeremia exigua]